MRYLVLSGPNLQKLGRREPHIYGSKTLADIHAELGELAELHGASVECRQSNHEGDLLDWIGAAQDDGFAGLHVGGYGAKPCGQFVKTAQIAGWQGVAAQEQFQRAAGDGALRQTEFAVLEAQLKNGGELEILLFLPL